MSEVHRSAAYVDVVVGVGYTTSQMLIVVVSNDVDTCKANRSSLPTNETIFTTTKNRKKSFWSNFQKFGLLFIKFWAIFYFFISLININISKNVPIFFNGLWFVSVYKDDIYYLCESLICHQTQNVTMVNVGLGNFSCLMKFEWLNLFKFLNAWDSAGLPQKGLTTKKAFH